MKSVYYMIVCALTVVLLVACGREQTPAETGTGPPEWIPNEEDLLQEWREIAEDDHEYMDIARAIEITQYLAQAGPDRLESLFEVIASPEEDAGAKMLAVICLTSFLDASYVPRLLTLAQPDHDTATRACAIHLLGNFPGEEADAYLREAMTDTDAHVGKVATLVLLRRGDSEAKDRVVALWREGDISTHDRNEIVLAFPDAHAERHLDLFKEAVCDSALDFPARERAIHIIGTLGDAPMADVLESCMEEERDPELRDMLRTAANAIRARNASPAAATPEHTGGPLE